MAFLWPISGEELLRLRREALPPVTFDGRVRRVQRLRPVRQTLSKGQEEAAAVARKLELLRPELVMLTRLVMVVVDGELVVVVVVVVVVDG